MIKEKLPDGWTEVELGDVLDYEQPTKYIVDSDEYNDDCKTPVLTAGKSFILGYTDENEGIYDKLPVIIFDDFTTANKFVTFPFKVKSSAMKLLTLKTKDADLKFIFWLMQTLNVNSITHKRYYLSKYQHIKIILPPLATQQKIVSILEKAEKAKGWRKEADKLTNDLLKSVFLDMFGDPVRNNKKWEIKTIEELSSEIVDCPHSTPNYVDYVTDFPCIRTTELKDGYIDWKQMKYLDEEGYTKRIKRLIPIEDDVIYGREGSFGESARVPTNTRISLGQRVMLFRPKSGVCNSVFLWALLRSKSIYFQASKKTSGSTVGHVNIKDIKKFKGICPPIKLQNEFSQIVEKIEAMRVTQKESKHELENLFNALMQKAFKGELAV
ncbi:MAG: restriction endonuclease subunit S [archaeon]